MIDFSCKCAICNSLITEQDKEKYQHEIDGIKFCYAHFQMLLENGLLFEGMDDMWHFTNFKNIELIL